MSLRLVDLIRKLDKETGVIQRSATIAVENIKQHVENLRPKFEESKVWARDILKDQTLLLENWKSNLDSYSKIPVFEELGLCLQGSRINSQKAKSRKALKPAPTLHDFVDVAQITNANDNGRGIFKRFNASVSELTTTFEKVSNDAHDLIESFSRAIASSDGDPSEQAGRLMEEIEVVTRKISADYDSVLGLPNNQKSISQVSKTALLHTRNLLPSLMETTAEIDQLLRDTTERKRETMVWAVDYMQKISTLESLVAQIHAQLANLGADIEDVEAFDTLSHLARLPSIYGALLIECVRRREWNDKITADSSSLVEEMAVYKEEETRRRKKWLKDMGGAVQLGNIDDMALGVDVNIQSQKQTWPNVTRQEVAGYIQSLQKNGPFEEIRGELEELFNTLDSPTRQQAKRAKAFKNGSIHEASFGRNSLILRGDDDLLQMMKNDKYKLEDKVRSSESRIRKLEDLLHRQSQISRAPAGTTLGISNGPTFERVTTSPTLNYAPSLWKTQDSPSRRSSVSSRRISMNHETEDKASAQRGVTLETDLTTVKAQATSLQKDATAKINLEEELKARVQELMSTKEDLMGNLEAQQREFDSERRSIEDENSKLKLKLEEVEDELDKVLESRDHDDKINNYEKDLEAMRKETAGEVHKMQEEIDALQKENNIHCERATLLQRQVQERADENAELNNKLNDVSTQIQNRTDVQANHHRTLRAALLQLSRDESAPDDFGSLVDLVEAIAERSASYLDTIKESLEIGQAEKAILESRMTEYTQKHHNLQERLGAEQIEVFSLRENLAQQKTQFKSLQEQMEVERGRYNDLLLECAATTKTNGLLQEKLDNNESRTANISSELAEKIRGAQKLEDTLADREKQLKGLCKIYDESKNHAEARASKAANVSKRLFLLTVSLGRLLEQIGFAVSKQDETMVIQKLPRAVSGSTLLNESSVPMNRSSSGPSVAKSGIETLLPSGVEWASDDPDIEASKFNEYIQDIKSFDIDAFNDAIIRRVKEAEHTARKWQREARAYRDKAQRAQNEAHDKIAFRAFKEGDLALFLPTKNQATKPWAAFNVGAPHYFLREQDSHKLLHRDWLLARISKVEERVVDLSKSLAGNYPASDRRSIGGTSDGGASFDDDNPFELSDGLRWYLLDAAEEKPGAPINIGLSKVTVASANVDAKGSIRMKKSLDGNGATKTLASFDSRRSSSTSKRGLTAVMSSSHPTMVAEPGERPESMSQTNEARSSDPLNPQIQRADPTEVRKDLLWGP